MTAGTLRLAALGRRDFASAFGLTRREGWLAEALLTPASLTFSRRLARFDLEISRSLARGAEALLDRHCSRLSVAGSVPSTGPVIICSNHPGLVDAMAVWKAARREDLLTIALSKEILEFLPQTRSRLVIVDPGNPSKAVREASKHLRRGGALLTFPAGKIERDPAITPDWRESLSCWGGCPDFLLKVNREVRLIPCLVSGVINPKALSSPWLSRLKTQKDRDWAAATLQILSPSLRRTDIRVEFGEPQPSLAMAAVALAKLLP